MLAEQSRYQTRSQTFSAALKRARRPVLVRNVITGALLLGFVSGVCILGLSKASILGQVSKSATRT
jgi:hypothetical protein